MFMISPLEIRQHPAPASLNQSIKDLLDEVEQLGDPWLYGKCRLSGRAGSNCRELK